MTDVEKQESQKTVVAFITGLLIGGLLVWVFSATPEEKPIEKSDVQTKEEVKKSEAPETVFKDDVTESKAETAAVTGTGTIVVEDQLAGNSVSLDALTLPIESGWVVVRDYMDGNPGNILGAARFNTTEGLVPTQVELVRSTTAGGVYQVVFYRNQGDIGFSLSDDTILEGVGTTFLAK
jgi:hypothetical protein